ncbi:mechanosensitive ion channel family protein [Chromobacterium subtsugae]|uniref:mechanosensitive ion channel family protein n=1 Tax=Chromobacterium subtsugae TaxID=251747 RepID=UPI000B1FB9A8|nr:hypothetical protein [Chromobacterium subtsugae]
MQNINWNHWLDLAANFAGNIVAAILLWLIGRWLIALSTRMLDEQLSARGLDPTLRR